MKKIKITPTDFLLTSVLSLLKTIIPAANNLKPSVQQF